MTDWAFSDRSQDWYSYIKIPQRGSQKLMSCRTLHTSDTLDASPSQWRKPSQLYKKKNSNPLKKFHQFLKVQPNVNQIFFPWIHRELFINLNQAFIWHLLKWHPFTYPFLLPAADFFSFSFWLVFYNSFVKIAWCQWENYHVLIRMIIKWFFGYIRGSHI